MENNEVIEVLNEEVVDTVCEDFSTNGSNPAVGVGVAVVLTLIGIGGYVLYKNRKKFFKPKTTKLVDSEEVVNEENEEQ